VAAEPLAAAEAALPKPLVAELTANGLSREDAVAALSHAGGSVAGAIEFHFASLAQVGGGPPADPGRCGGCNRLAWGEMGRAKCTDERVSWGTAT
jgi:hypothetical protein